MDKDSLLATSHCIWFEETDIEISPNISRAISKILQAQKQEMVEKLNKLRTPLVKCIDEYCNGYNKCSRVINGDIDDLIKSMELE